MEKTSLEAGFDRALVELEISTNVPYPLTQNLGSDFVSYPNFQKRSQKNFYGFYKNRFPIWVATQNEFLRPTSFGKNPKRLLSPKPVFGFRKTEPFSKRIKPF